MIWETAVDASQSSKRVYLDQEEDGFVAVTSEFPHLSEYAETPELARKELTILIEEALGVHIVEGRPVHVRNADRNRHEFGYPAGKEAP